MMKVFQKIRVGDKRVIKLFGCMIFSYSKRNNNYVSNGSRFANCDIDDSAFIDDNCDLGEYTYIGKDVDITKAKIGRYCSIAPHVRIGMGEHDTAGISTSSILSDTNGYDDLTKKDCEIKNDVWIGTESVIRRGVVVGNCAVIGANSFVNRDVPDFAVVAGSPAKIIKYRFDENVRRKILESGYWRFSPKEAREVIAKLQVATMKGFSGDAP